MRIERVDTAVPRTDVCSRDAYTLRGDRDRVPSSMRVVACADIDCRGYLRRRRARADHRGSRAGHGKERVGDASRAQRRADPRHGQGRLRQLRVPDDWKAVPPDIARLVRETPELFASL